MLNSYIGELNEKYISKRSNIPFGLAVITEVSRKQANPEILKAKEKAIQIIKDNTSVIKDRIKKYDDYFNSFDYKCPLLNQFNRTMENGLPTINRFVDTMFICEMTEGILMGAQDYGNMKGKLSFDLADPGESYEGMHGVVTCIDGEIIVRDSEGIVASFFQGSDARTQITRQTGDVVFFCFGLPGMNPEEIKSSLKKAVSILGPFGKESKLQML